MKKIGILTFQNADNYGALLQAYALKQVLINQGHVVKILNYCCPKIQAAYRINIQRNYPLTFIRKLKICIKLLLFLPLWWYVKTKFSFFRKKHLIDTPKYYSDTIKQVFGYDLFITGSDQVFNPRLTGFDSNYFLAFSSNKTKNVSYAASFGFGLKDLSEKEKLFIQQNLSHLKCLSVREQQGAEIIRLLTGRTSQVNIDPTFLLTKDEWVSLAKLPKVKKPYVLVYLMNEDSNIISFAKKLAHNNNYELLYISSTLDIKQRLYNRHITPTPQEWLGLFLKAQYIVTNSFHGLVFSIIFNKHFFVGNLPKTWPANSRLDNLLGITNLQNRIYTNFTQDYNKPIDWSFVNRCVGKERQKALNYLQEITH